MNRLPTELTDYTIDFLHSDKQALKVCSLVCRNWLPSSRFHLFGEIRVDDHNAHSFLRRLAFPSSSFAVSHIHTLRIFMMRVGDSTVFDIIAPYFEHFSAIKSIRLEGRRWAPISAKGRSREFGRVGNMDLTSVEHDFFNSWFSFDFTLGDGGRSTFSSRLGALHSTFELYGGKTSLWMPVLAKLPAVHEFTLAYIEKSHLPTVQAMLKSGGESIHTLELEFSRSAIAWISDYIDLTHNTNLRSLSITNLNLCYSFSIAGYGSFPRTIQRISSPSFAHMEISALVDDAVDLTWLGCKKVADELNRSRFAELQRVSVVISERSNKGGAIPWVRREMSCLDNRGILDALSFQ